VNWNAFGRETMIVFKDFGREAEIQTSSRKLYETLMVAGVRCEEVDGIYTARVPKRWLRLRTPCGLLHLGWYPSSRQRSDGVLALFEDRPKLRVLRPGEAVEA